MERVATTLMRIFAVGLGMDKHYFDDKGRSPHHQLQRAALSRAAKAAAARSAARRRAHRLRQPDHPEAGQRAGRSAGAERTAPGSTCRRCPERFVVNLGDLMAEWTNDRWVSTLHRVINPPRDKALGSRRLSMAFFHQPNYDAVIECLPTCSGADRPAALRRGPRRASTSG